MTEPLADKHAHSVTNVVNVLQLINQLE